MTGSTEYPRRTLIAALRADLIGPFVPETPDGPAAREILPQKPTRWYLTGFLSPEGAREPEQDPTTEDDTGAGDDLDDPETGGEDPPPRLIKHRWPASIGLSVLLPQSARQIVAHVRYAEYVPVSLEAGSLAPPGRMGTVGDQATPDGVLEHPSLASNGTTPVNLAERSAALRSDSDRPRPRRTGWQRQRSCPEPVPLPLDVESLAQGVSVPKSAGIRLVGQLTEASGNGLPAGTRALSLFLVNGRNSPDPRHVDDDCIFQVELELECAEGFAPRPNVRGALSEDFDDRVSDLQFRSHYEYAVGHGVSVEVAYDGASSVATSSDPDRPPPVTRVRTTWLPYTTVPTVLTRSDDAVTTDMDVLACSSSAAELQDVLRPLASAYADWIAIQRTTSVSAVNPETTAQLTAGREATRGMLMDRAEVARQRILNGIDWLSRDPDVCRAFQLMNRAMAESALRRSPERYDAQQRPSWRLFQLAFVLLCLPGLADPSDEYRDDVDLIFFPTGGGKTEAYLGVIAFTLLLRRLRGKDRPDRGLGVTVLLRYTLRLLTLDQLGRASTLMCALEQLRRANAELGPHRFAVGLWVGSSATANKLEHAADQIERYNADTSPSAVCPFPLTACPWCGSHLLAGGQRAFSLLVEPSVKSPERIAVSCTDFNCDFSSGEGLPVAFVDDQIYRELPAFIIATVDKFAMLPWRGETGLLFGRAQAEAGGRFYGPLSKAPKAATLLPEGLRPPELIVQDELHLISGPLGTLVGLYETAIEHLCTYHPCNPLAPGGKPVKPKLIAATATVRRASQQVQALFGRSRTALFPPPGINDSDTYFAKAAVVDENNPGRVYVGVSAPGRPLKALLLPSYVSLLAAARRLYQPQGSDTQTADGYMTLAGYFNSLRELGGMRRLVEDDVRTRAANAEKRAPLDYEGAHPWYLNRNIAEPVELTSREPTERIKKSKGRLGTPYAQEQHVDVLLASNMISVGVDIDRLGVMIVAGQPKTTSEYIQASSRVGRDKRYPGLVVTCLNLSKPRDRSHYERFIAYHDSFYRDVEATSLTPFSGPALERGLAGVVLAMTRLSDPLLTHPSAVMDLGMRESTVAAVVEALVARAQSQPGDSGDLPEQVRKQVEVRFDTWRRLIEEARDSAARYVYSGYDVVKSPGAPLMHTPLDHEAVVEDCTDAGFIASTSMRDVEPTVHLWLPGAGGE